MSLQDPTQSGWMLLAVDTKLIPSRINHEGDHEGECNIDAVYLVGIDDAGSLVISHALFFIREVVRGFQMGL